ncbi:MAG: hypothetical protein K8R39_00815 [Arcobacteraceae bacterium]|nr:hypothetical protein [Arcobacteraceae bacterium]
MQQELINIKHKINRYKNDLEEDYILIETTLSVLEYMLSENISNEERKSLYKSIENTIEMIAGKISKIEK